MFCPVVKKPYLGALIGSVAETGLDRDQTSDQKKEQNI